MEMSETRRRNARLVLLTAVSDERQVDRTLMAAWSVRQRHPDAPIAVVTDRPGHRLWRSGLFNIVVSAADLPEANTADCCLLALERGIFDRALHLDSHCRLRADDVDPAFAALDKAEIAVAMDAEGPSSGIVMMRRTKQAAALLKGWSERIRAGMATGPGLDRVIRRAAANDMVAGLPEGWLPRPSGGEADVPLVEVRRGDVARLYAELLNFALHRLLSNDMKRAAAVYARVALAAHPDLPQLGSERLVAHISAMFGTKLPRLGQPELAQLDALLHHAAREDPAGNLLGIAALHLEMGQVKTAIAVLRMVYHMRFRKPAPLPG
ncbi:MAG: hypothetical protein TEF_05505 [Rhizobiales bacterium NRL2]|jgi:hypothetical protein|nr:MAG: hypothetical protein TEF_05505 [Rhizobiales bacterium NRL2]